MLTEVYGGVALRNGDGVSPSLPDDPTERAIASEGDERGGVAPERDLRKLCIISYQSNNSVHISPIARPSLLLSPQTIWSVVCCLSLYEPRSAHLERIAMVVVVVSYAANSMYVSSMDGQIPVVIISVMVVENPTSAKV